jgi:hypothetical protein
VGPALAVGAGRGWLAAWAPAAAARGASLEAPGRHRCHPRARTAAGAKGRLQQLLRGCSHQEMLRAAPTRWVARPAHMYVCVGGGGGGWSAHPKELGWRVLWVRTPSWHRQHVSSPSLPACSPATVHPTAPSHTPSLHPSTAQSPPCAHSCHQSCHCLDTSHTQRSRHSSVTPVSLVSLALRSG